MKYLIALVFLSGCYTAEKAARQVNKANYKHPEVVAKIARDFYPCTDLLKDDTTIFLRDTLIYIECPDNITPDSKFETVRFDTLNKTITKIVRVPVNMPIITQVVTKWYEDSAKLKIASIQAIKLTADNESLQSKLARRTKYLWWLLALCIGLTVWIFIKLFI